MSPKFVQRGTVFRQGRVQRYEPTGPFLDHFFSFPGNTVNESFFLKSITESLVKAVRSLNPVTPVMIDLEVFDDPGKSSHVIQLRVSRNHVSEPSNALIPQIRSHHHSANIPTFIGGPAVHQNRFAARKFEHRSVTLTNVQKRHAQRIILKHVSRRPHPPQQEEDQRTPAYDSQRQFPIEQRDHETKIESCHGKNCR